jgi:pimeloyl-ACP methyl ester carboxylesterase
VVDLATGAEMRLTGTGAVAVVCVNGGQASEVEGTWSASLEWLVRRLAPQFPGLVFAEVRYRVKSWRRLEACVEDARAAVRALGEQRTVLLGFSMGGAVAISTADGIPGRSMNGSESTSGAGFRSEASSGQEDDLVALQLPPP